jgi:hypothetical protein
LATQSAAPLQLPYEEQPADKVRAEALLRSIGKLEERLFWKLNHEKAAEKGYAVNEKLALARTEGTKVRQDRVSKRKQEVEACQDAATP